MNIETFLELKLKHISSIQDDFHSEIPIYSNFYKGLKNENFIEILTLFHYRLNSLLTFMNYKNEPGSNKHYNAQQSRDLIELIKQIRGIQETLKYERSEFSFKIDDYYENIINNCKSFLSSSNGSTIPEDFLEIKIIDFKPIFILSDSSVVQDPNKTQTVNIKLVDHGSYATVYKYTDPHYNCKFAIKRAKKNLRPDELERFQNEYHVLKKLNSPFIICAYHYNDKKNEYTMEYADKTLDQFIKSSNNTLLLDERRALVVQLLNAFEYIHSKGLLHRDISYHNILIKHYDDGSNLLKISDFGLVKLPESVLTRQGTDIKGAINDYNDLMTIGFENYEIRHETYALTKVIYFILTGKQSKYAQEQNAALKSFILKGLSPDKNERFRSVKEMKEELIKVVLPSLRLDNEKTNLEIMTK